MPVSAFAQPIVLLPIGNMLNLTQPYAPVTVKGLKINPENPFQFDFIIDPGDSGMEGEVLQEESTKLIKYFLASLTVPESDLWVNLSPYEEDRIIPEQFGMTEMGRELLAQDYLLKQLTSSLMYPEDGGVGQKFWERIKQKSGLDNIPVNTFNKVWIVPEEATVYEGDGVAYVVESRLKVMLEEDYLALASSEQRIADSSSQPSADNSLNAKRYTPNAEIIRDIILPVLEEEVNQGTHFAPLRQIYNSLILASWYKRKLKNSVLTQVYVDQNKTKGVTHGEEGAAQKIYDQYVESFKVGVYDYIKEEYDPVAQQIIPRKYFSGGFGFDQAVMDNALRTENKDNASLSTLKNIGLFAAAGAAFVMSVILFKSSDEVESDQIRTIIEKEISEEEQGDDSDPNEKEPFEDNLFLDETEVKPMMSAMLDLKSNIITSIIENGLPSHWSMQNSNKIFTEMLKEEYRRAGFDQWDPYTESIIFDENMISNQFSDLLDTMRELNGDVERFNRYAQAIQEQFGYISDFHRLHDGSDKERRAVVNHNKGYFSLISSIENSSNRDGMPEEKLQYFNEDIYGLYALLPEEDLSLAISSDYESFYHGLRSYIAMSKQEPYELGRFFSAVSQWSTEKDAEKIIGNRLLVERMVDVSSQFIITNDKDLVHLTNIISVASMKVSREDGSLSLLRRAIRGGEVNFDLIYNKLNYDNVEFASLSKADTANVLNEDDGALQDAPTDPAAMDMNRRRFIRTVGALMVLGPVSPFLQGAKFRFVRDQWSFYYHVIVQPGDTAQSIIHEFLEKMNAQAALPITKGLTPDQIGQLEQKLLDDNQALIGRDGKFVRKAKLDLNGVYVDLLALYYENNIQSKVKQEIMLDKPTLFHMVDTPNPIFTGIGRQVGHNVFVNFYYLRKKLENLKRKLNNSPVVSDLKKDPIGAEIAQHVYRVFENDFKNISDKRIIKNYLLEIAYHETTHVYTTERIRRGDYKRSVERLIKQYNATTDIEAPEFRFTAHAELAGALGEIAASQYPKSLIHEIAVNRAFPEVMLAEKLVDFQWPPEYVIAARIIREELLIRRLGYSMEGAREAVRAWLSNRIGSEAANRRIKNLSPEEKKLMFISSPAAYKHRMDFIESLDDNDIRQEANDLLIELFGDVPKFENVKPRLMPFIETVMQYWQTNYADGENAAVSEPAALQEPTDPAAMNRRKFVKTAVSAAGALALGVDAQAKKKKLLKGEFPGHPWNEKKKYEFVRGANGHMIPSENITKMLELMQLPTEEDFKVLGDYLKQIMKEKFDVLGDYLIEMWKLSVLYHMPYDTVHASKGVRYVNISDYSPQFLKRNIINRDYFGDIKDARGIKMIKGIKGIAEQLDAGYGKNDLGAQFLGVFLETQLPDKVLDEVITGLVEMGMVASPANESELYDLEKSLSDLFRKFMLRVHKPFHKMTDTPVLDPSNDSDAETLGDKADAAAMSEYDVVEFSDNLQMLYADTEKNKKYLELVILTRILDSIVHGDEVVDQQESFELFTSIFKNRGSEGRQRAIVTSALQRLEDTPLLLSQIIEGIKEQVNQPGVKKQDELLSALATVGAHILVALPEDIRDEVRKPFDQGKIEGIKRQQKYEKDTRRLIDEVQEMGDAFEDTDSDTAALNQEPTDPAAMGGKGDAASFSHTEYKYKTGKTIKGLHQGLRKLYEEKVASYDQLSKAYSKSTMKGFLIQVLSDIESIVSDHLTEDSNGVDQLEFLYPIILDYLLDNPDVDALFTIFGITMKFTDTMNFEFFIRKETAFNNFEDPDELLYDKETAQMALNLYIIDLKSQTLDLVKEIWSNTEKGLSVRGKLMSDLFVLTSQKQTERMAELIAQHEDISDTYVEVVRDVLSFSKYEIQQNIPTYNQAEEIDVYLNTVKGRLSEVISREKVGNIFVDVLIYHLQKIKTDLEDDFAALDSEAKPDPAAMAEGSVQRIANSDLNANRSTLDAKKGGIDLNPANWELKTKGMQGSDCSEDAFDDCLKFDIPQEQIEQLRLSIDGLVPVIINVQPMTNLPLFLGLADELPDDPEPYEAAKAEIGDLSHLRQEMLKVLGGRC